MAAGAPTLGCWCLWWLLLCADDWEHGSGCTPARCCTMGTGAGGGIRSMRAGARGGRWCCHAVADSGCCCC